MNDDSFNFEQLILINDNKLLIVKHAFLKNVKQRFC